MDNNSFEPTSIYMDTRSGPVTYEYGYFTTIPYIICCIAIISISIAGIKHNKKNIKMSASMWVIGILLYFMGMYRAIMTTPMLGGLGGGPTIIHIQYPLISKILFIISIIIQLIPFIICLKNNKKIKKDEVKQNV